MDYAEFKVVLAEEVESEVAEWDSFEQCAQAAWALGLSIQDAADSVESQFEKR